MTAFLIAQMVLVTVALFVAVDAIYLYSQLKRLGKDDDR